MCAVVLHIHTHACTLPVGEGWLEKGERKCEAVKWRTAAVRGVDRLLKDGTSVKTLYQYLGAAVNLYTGRDCTIDMRNAPRCR